ncbi:MAG: hypothetical protein K6T66_09040 [Peptococcaceae bacterium]|nr:hypothetical protein [Peptococcaceae bacterium]
MFRVTENGLKEISIEEYLNTQSEEQFKKTKNLNEKGLESQKAVIQSSYDYYDEYGWGTFRKSGGRCSRYAENYTSNTMSYAIQYSKTQGYSVSVSLTTPEFSALKAGVSFTWNNSASVSDTATLYVSPYHRGWWEFDPLMNNSWGVIEHYEGGVLVSEKFVDAYSPKKIGSLLDGYLVAMEEQI